MNGWRFIGAKHEFRRCSGVSSDCQWQQRGKGIGGVGEWGRWRSSGLGCSIFSAGTITQTCSRLPPTPLLQRWEICATPLIKSTTTWPVPFGPQRIDALVEDQTVEVLNKHLFTRFLLMVISPQTRDTSYTNPCICCTCTMQHVLPWVSFPVAFSVAITHSGTCRCQI